MNKNILVSEVPGGGARWAYPAHGLMAKEYDVTMDTSSLMSSETERDDTDDEILSFDLGPELCEPDQQTRLPSDEWLDDHQQGLHPGSSEPRYDPYDKYLAMPNQTSIMDMMRSDMETSELNKAPPPRARAPPNDTLGLRFCQG